ncbi:MAG: 3-dehydroquinate synthase [Chloroflexota bacterium]
MHIFLYGPSGSGKSTVGKLLAKSLNLPFLDLDTEIERTSGQLIQQTISMQGEHVFRDLETKVLKIITSNTESIIALGGGALLRDENRRLVHTLGQVVFLEVDLSTLISRLANDENKRPLLAGKLEPSLQSLLDSRQEHYDSFPLRVDASRNPDQAAWEIQVLIGRYHLRSMPPAYDVLVQEGGLESIGDLLKQRGLSGPILVVSDSNVAPLYLEDVLNSLRACGFAASKLVIPAGEAHKNIDTVSSIWLGCLAADLDRKSTLVALGGGVVGDLAGFAAATFMRGLNWVAVPTTLLAMVDASMGGKTGFDLPEGKNLVGVFHPPRFVLADPEVLDTLPERELRAGLAEVVKHGIIADPDLFNLCSQGWETIKAHLPEVVRRGMAVKVKIIEEDPFEQGIRAALNFGHTVGHAIELVSQFNLLHGEAVAIGMVVETNLAERLSIAEKGLAATLQETLSKLRLPVDIPNNLPQAEITDTMRSDKKKSAGIIRFALPEKIGIVRVGIEIENLESVL